MSTVQASGDTQFSQYSTLSKSDDHRQNAVVDQNEFINFVDDYNQNLKNGEAPLSEQDALLIFEHSTQNPTQGMNQSDFASAVEAIKSETHQGQGTGENDVYSGITITDANGKATPAKSLQGALSGLKPGDTLTLSNKANGEYMEITSTGNGGFNTASYTADPNEGGRLISTQKGAGHAYVGDSGQLYLENDHAQITLYDEAGKPTDGTLGDLRIDEDTIRNILIDQGKSSTQADSLIAQFNQSTGNTTSDQATRQDWMFFFDSL